MPYQLAVTISFWPEGVPPRLRGGGPPRLSTDNHVNSGAWGLDGPKTFFGNPQFFVEDPKKSLEFRKMAIKRATELGSSQTKLHEKAETMENLAAISKMRDSFIIRTIFHFEKPPKKRPKNFFGYFFGQKTPKNVFWTI